MVSGIKFNLESSWTNINLKFYFMLPENLDSVSSSSILLDNKWLRKKLVYEIDIP